MKINDTDSDLDKIREICSALPEFKEVQAWGHPTFRAGKKMFAAFGALEGTRSLGLKVGFDRQEQLLKDKRFFPTPYAAHQGWVSLHFNDGIAVNWDEVTALLHEAYRQVANQRMLKALDGAIPPHHPPPPTPRRRPRARRR